MNAGRPQRIVLVLGSSALSHEATQAALEMAERLSVQLLALFIEDEALLRAAALPFGSRLVWGKSKGEPLAAESLLAEWGALADRARRAMEREATRRRVPLEFRITRGLRAAVVAGASSAGDLLLLTAARAPGHRPLRPALRKGASLHVLFDGSQAGQRALACAKLLVDAGHSLEVWLPRGSVGLAERVHALAGPVPTRTQAGTSASREEVQWTLTSAANGMLLLPAESALAQAVSALSLDGPLPCWVALVQ